MMDNFNQQPHPPTPPASIPTPTVPAEQPPPHWIKWVLIILLVALLSSSVTYFALTQREEKSQPSPIVQTPPSPTPTPDPTANWKTYANSKFSFLIKHPPDFEVSDEGGILIQKIRNEPSGIETSFAYISIIPDGFVSRGGEIYNYITEETNKLLALGIGETVIVDPGLTNQSYTRLPDITVGGLPAKLFENYQPWEFPQGTKERRLYIHNGIQTYMIGGYLKDKGEVSPEFFNQILSTFRFD